MGRERTGARPAQIQDGALLVCRVPGELGDRNGSQQLVKLEAEASPEIPLQLPSPGMRGDCEAPSWKEEGEHGSRPSPLT